MENLKQLYKQLSQLTYSKCISAHRNCPGTCGCCDDYYCGLAQEYALEYYNVELKPTQHKTIRFMGDNGCVVPPHLRPICTAEDCVISSSAFGVDELDLNYTERYWRLRDKILLESFGG